MFKKLEEFKKKNKGTKFMDLPESIRNTKEGQDAMSEFQNELSELLGADTLTLFLLKKKPDGTSRYLGNKNQSVEGAVLLTEAVIDMATLAIEPKVAAVIHAAHNSSGNGNESDSHQYPSDKDRKFMAYALQEALEGLPDKYKKQVLGNMQDYMDKKIGKNESKRLDDDEDDLLEDLLK